jgi:hypothetical protein
MSDWTKRTTIPTVFRNRAEPILGITFDKHRPDAFILVAASYMCTVNMSLEMQRKDSYKLTYAKTPMAMNMDHRFQNILAFKAMGKEIVVVERPVLHVLAELPPAFHKAKYGS